MLRSLLLAALGFCATAAAQNSFTVPSKALTTEPGSVWFDASHQSYAFWGTTSTTIPVSRVQYLYEVTDIPVANATLQALMLRPARGYSLQAATYQTTIIISVGPNSASGASTTFAANHGPGPVTAFTGPVSLPAVTVTTWPGPWQPLPFSQPVAFASAAGQTLVVEFQSTSSSNQRSWIIEGFREEAGRSNLEQSLPTTCVNSGGLRNSGWGWNSGELVPGGSFTLSLFGYPPNTPSFAANGLFFGVQGAGSLVGGHVTPFPLASAGLPVPPTCPWGIDISAGSYPMAYVQTTGTNPSASLRMSNVAIANSPNLAGVTFYTQNLALDHDGVNPPSLYPSTAIEWIIGPGTPIPASRVHSLSNSLQPTGSRTESNAAVLRFVY